MKNTHTRHKLTWPWTRNTFVVNEVTAERWKIPSTDICWKPTKPPTQLPPRYRESEKEGNKINSVKSYNFLTLHCLKITLKKSHFFVFSAIYKKQAWNFDSARDREFTLLLRLIHYQSLIPDPWSISFVTTKRFETPIFERKLLFILTN